MQANELEAAVERFNTSLSGLQVAAERLKATKPLEEQERAMAVTRIDQAITALRRVLGEEGSNATGHS